MKNLKQDLMIEYKKELIISKVSFLISFISISSIVLMILFLMAFLDPSSDTAPIFLVIFVLLCLISFIIGLVYNSKKNKTRGHLDFYSSSDQNEYLKKYLIYQIIIISLLFIGVFLLGFGFIFKYKEGITVSFFGLILIVISLSWKIITSIKTTLLRSRKSEILDDLIDEYSVFKNMNIVERISLFILLAASVILFLDVIVDSRNILLIVFLIILYTFIFGYTLYISVKCKVKHSKSLKK